MARLQLIKGGEPVGMGLADYIWLDDNGLLLFKKKSILIGKDDKGNPVPLLDRWTYEYGEPDDDQTQTRVLSPYFYLPDPTRPQPNYLVPCEVRDAEDHCVEINWRAKLRLAIDDRGKMTNLVWFGFEQEYLLTEAGTKEEDGYEARRFNTSERHLGACFDAGLLIHSAWNPPANSQPWDFKIGYRGFPQDLDPDPPNALIVADHLILARYLMEKIGGSKGLVPEWGNLSIFVSTPALREPGGNHLAEATRMAEALSPLGKIRHIPHPTHGGHQCLQVNRDTPHDPYKLAYDVLLAVWPLDSTE